MYVDGHEREDVVEYSQNVFVPQWQCYEAMARWWNPDGQEEGDVWERVFVAGPGGKIIVVWRHDESTFYANGRRRLRHIHNSETAKPYAKGEGISMMVADLISLDYGWLTSKVIGSDR